MKLQYLGDKRDAFKWDFLHWLCTSSSPKFSSLLVVPLLTKDDGSNEGLTSSCRFRCRDFICEFLKSLSKRPHSMTRIKALGTANPDAPFRVEIFKGKTTIGSGKCRAEYWSGFEQRRLDNTVVFFDPDNGFETKTQHRAKWIRHKELEELLSKLPESSVAVVYQHHWRREWDSQFADLRVDLRMKVPHARAAVAVYEGNLAFIALARTKAVGKRVRSAVRSYCDRRKRLGLNPRTKQRVLWA